jgi:RecA-family ATPase
MPEQKWIIDQLLPVGGALYLHGMPKVGKSLLSLGAAQSIAGAATNWLGFPVRVHGRVLYVQIDMSPTLWHTYIMRVLDSGKTMGNLFLIDRMELPNYTLNLQRPKDAEWLKGQVDMVQPEVIILDTLRSLHSGEENDNTIMSNLYEKILGIIGPRALILVHHSRKPGLLTDLIADARGATSVAGKVDVIAQLVKHKKSFKLHYATRDDNLFPDGLALTQDKQNGLFHPQQTPKAIFAQLQMERPEATVKELMDALLEHGVSKSSAHRLISGQSLEKEED